MSIFKSREHFVQRSLEILPGFVSWNMIFFPYWGIFLIPEVVAYFVLFFNIYWFYQSFVISITATISHLRLQAAMRYDWVGDLKEFPDWERVHQVIIIPMYKEPLYILERTIASVAKQTLPLKQITIVLAQEKRAPEEGRLAVSEPLRKKYAKMFGNFFVTTHELEVGEVIGKASNERYAAIWTRKELVEKQGMDMKYIVVTSCDSDHVYHPNHFAHLAYTFLDDPDRYRKFFQPAVFFYNNIWELPAITRVPNTLMSIWNLSQLPRKDRLISQQNYSLSLKLLHDTDYWDANKIPEDWGIFFKAYFKNGGHIEVEPIYLPVYADAAQSSGFWSTIKNQYEQIKRWAWGVSDDPWVIKSYFMTKNMPFIDKTFRLFFLVKSHFLWPVNWFIITIGVTLPSLLNPRFARTALGYTVPKLSSFVLTLSLGFLILTLIIDHYYKPKRPKNFPLWRALLTPLEFVLMPVSGFIFGALPGLDAHTRLMLGKYMEYKVTEKV